MNLILVVDEAGSGAALAMTMLLRSRFMQQGLANEALCAGRTLKKDGPLASDAWRAAAHACNLSLDRAQASPLTKKDLKRADVVVVLEVRSAEKLRQQRIFTHEWLPQGGALHWPATTASLDEFLTWWEKEDPLQEASELGAASSVVPIDGVLDLHTFHPRDTRTLIPEYLEACHARGITALRIIHGKGTGALKRSVHAQLGRHPLVSRFYSAGEGAGGWGATLVDLKPVVAKALSEPSGDA